MKLTNLVIPDAQQRAKFIAKGFGYFEIEKAGQRDTSKLQKKEIMNKSGHKQTVYVKGASFAQNAHNLLTSHGYEKKGDFDSPYSWNKETKADSPYRGSVYVHPKGHAAIVRPNNGNLVEHFSPDAKDHPEHNSKYEFSRPKKEEKDSGKHRLISKHTVGKYSIGRNGHTNAEGTHGGVSDSSAFKDLANTLDTFHNPGGRKRGMERYKQEKQRDKERYTKRRESESKQKEKRSQNLKDFPKTEIGSKLSELGFKGNHKSMNQYMKSGNVNSSIHSLFSKHLGQGYEKNPEHLARALVIANAKMNGSGVAGKYGLSLSQADKKGFKEMYDSIGSKTVGRYKQAIAHVDKHRSKG